MDRGKKYTFIRDSWGTNRKKISTKKALIPIRNFKQYQQIIFPKTLNHILTHLDFYCKGSRGKNYSFIRILSTSPGTMESRNYCYVPAINQYLNCLGICSVYVLSDDKREAGKRMEGGQGKGDQEWETDKRLKSDSQKVGRKTERCVCGVQYTCGMGMRPEQNLS